MLNINRAFIKCGSVCRVANCLYFALIIFNTCTAFPLLVLIPHIIAPSIQVHADKHMWWQQAEVVSPQHLHAFCVCLVCLSLRTISRTKWPVDYFTICGYDLWRFNHHSRCIVFWQQSFVALWWRRKVISFHADRKWVPDAHSHSLSEYWGWGKAMSIEQHMKVLYCVLRKSASSPQINLLINTFRNTRRSSTFGHNRTSTCRDGRGNAHFELGENAAKLKKKKEKTSAGASMHGMNACDCVDVTIEFHSVDISQFYWRLNARNEK